MTDACPICAGLGYYADSTGRHPCKCDAAKGVTSDDIFDMACAEARADIWMEACAALITMTGKNEVRIPQRYLPMSPFEIVRKVRDGELVLELVRVS